MTLCAGSASGEPDQRLRNLGNQLRRTLHDLGDNVTYRFDNGGRTLVAEFQTREFLVHVGSKAGKKSLEAHKVLGPSYVGFLIRIHLQDAGTLNQAVLPQVIREPYWETSLDVCHLDSKKQVYVAFSYGGRLNETIRKRLVGFWKDVDKEVSSEPSRRAAGNEAILEGKLQVHPKFSFRYYLDGLANGQSCGLKGVDEKLKNVHPGTRIRVQGYIRSHHFEASAHDQPNAALVIADYLYMNVKQFEVVGSGNAKKKPSQE